MDREKTLTPETFATLLGWLDADEQAAAEKYENIRARLIALFIARGCNDAEELADRTIDRVAEKLDEIIRSYSGEPIRYFYTVSKYILQEWKREQRAVFGLSENSSANDTDAEKERLRKFCLGDCIETLREADQEVLLAYYRGEKGKKIENRNMLAKELGVTRAALQMRTSRLRSRLLKCVGKCMDEKINR